MMKDHFNRFAIRFLSTLFLGMMLLLAHRWSGNAAVAPFLPVFASPWELSKLAYWPVLVTLLLTGSFSGGLRRTFENAMPCLLLMPLALFLANWAVSVLRPAGGIYLLAWVVVSAIGLALAEQKHNPKWTCVWLVLVITMGALYVVFSYLPPLAGPFLDPSDVAAMGTIPC